MLDGSLRSKQFLGSVAYSDHLSLHPDYLLKEPREEVLVLFISGSQLPSRD
jgi:hypothetical protein